MFLQCVVTEKIHTHPMEGHRKFLGEGGSEKPKFWEESTKLNWNFLGGGGCKTKNLPWGSMDIYIYLFDGVCLYVICEMFRKKVSDS